MSENKTGSYSVVQPTIYDYARALIAKDVCAILGYSDTANGCRILDEDEKDVVMRSELPSLFEESSNAPAMTLISESGLYALVIRSNKPDAKVFRKWVTDDAMWTLKRASFEAHCSVSELCHAIVMQWMSEHESEIKKD